MLKIVILFVAAALALVTAEVPRECHSIQNNLDWNNPALFGRWLEVHRMPKGLYDCIEFDVKLEDGETLSIATRRARIRDTSQGIEEEATVQLVSDQKSGYALEFTSGNFHHVKLLICHEEKYIVGCGYTKETDDRTSYSFILARADKYNSDGIRMLIMEASESCSNFRRPSYWDLENIDQIYCREDGISSQSPPMLPSALAMTALMINLH